MSEFDRLVEREVRRILIEDRELLVRDIKAELLASEWRDQQGAILGRNRHIRLAKRLIAAHSPDALYTDDGRWMVRTGAIDAEIVRLNREEPPPAVTRLTPVPPRPLPLAKTEGEEFGDETGIYRRQLLERFGGGK